MVQGVSEMFQMGTMDFSRTFLEVSKRFRAFEGWGIGRVYKGFKGVTCHFQEDFIGISVETTNYTEWLLF